MQTKLKIPRLLVEAALADLYRPHPVAAERVGFFSTKVTRAKSIVIVHCIAYHPVSDADYIRDNSVGARIGSGAITEAMARCAADVGQLPVHAHGGGWASVLISPERDDAVEGQVALIGYPITVARARRIAVQAPLWWRKLFRRKCAIGNRYDRQSFLGPDSDKIFANLRVGIVGLGGGGSHIAQQLAHLGVCHFVLCDPDTISESNLNRTVAATESDVDHHTCKTTIAKRQIRGLHPDADIVVIGKWQSRSEPLLHCDVVLGCVDTFAGRRDLESFCRRHLIPYVEVGMDVLKESGRGHEIIGQVILSMPGRPCMHCMGFLTEELLAEEARRYGAAGGRPQVVFANGVICSAGVGVVVDLVTSWSGNRRQSVYLNFRGSDLSLRDDPRLRHLADTCEHYPLIQAGDPTWTPL